MLFRRTPRRSDHAGVILTAVVAASRPRSCGAGSQPDERPTARCSRRGIDGRAGCSIRVGDAGDDLMGSGTWRERRVYLAALTASSERWRRRRARGGRRGTRCAVPHITWPALIPISLSIRRQLIAAFKVSPRSTSHKAAPLTRRCGSLYNTRQPPGRRARLRVRLTLDPDGGLVLLTVLQFAFGRRRKTWAPRRTAPGSFVLFSGASRRLAAAVRCRSVIALIPSRCVPVALASALKQSKSSTRLPRRLPIRRRSTRAGGSALLETPRLIATRCRSSSESRRDGERGSAVKGTRSRRSRAGSGCFRRHDRMIHDSATARACPVHPVAGSTGWHVPAAT